MIGLLIIVIIRVTNGNIAYDSDDHDISRGGQRLWGSLVLQGAAGRRWWWWGVAECGLGWTPC